VKRVLLVVVVVAGCWTSAPRQPTPAPIENAAKPPPPVGEGKQITRTATGGVVQLDGDHAVAQRQADSLMAEHCGPNRYSITQEGEEAIGSDAIAGEPVRIMTAWRIHYVCADAP
jgi:hypothetical protein